MRRMIQRLFAEYIGAEQHEKGNYSEAVDYYTKAIELDNVEAHFNLSRLLLQNWEDDVENTGKKIAYHLEEAAICGHPDARYILGCNEWIKGNYKRAMKHLIIGATQGHDDSIKELTTAFKEGFMEKEDLEAALRAHKAAVDATKSPQREIGEEHYGTLNESKMLR